jgi:hypothetical protein
MNIVEHVTFDQLPSECKCLLSIATTAASLRTGNRHRQADESLTSIARGFWNASRLAPSDLRDFRGLTNQLCTWIKSTGTTLN